MGSGYSKICKLDSKHFTNVFASNRIKNVEDLRGTSEYKTYTDNNLNNEVKNDTMTCFFFL